MFIVDHRYCREQLHGVHGTDQVLLRDAYKWLITNTGAKCSAGGNMRR